MTESSRFGLSPRTLQALVSVFTKYSQIESVLIYGSRAKGNYRPGSDIDLTIVAPQMDLSTRFKIETEIDDLLLPYKIDLTLIHEIENQNLLDHIERIGVPIYGASVAP